MIPMTISMILFVFIGAVNGDVPSCSGPVSVDDIVFTPSGMSWNAANDWCIAQGMELVSIHDEESQNAVYEACKTGWSEGTSFSRVWFGLNGIDQPFSVDNFMWSDGSDVDYTNWRDGHPRIDEECIMMYCGGGGSQGTWASHECSWGQPYGVCRRCSESIGFEASFTADSLSVDGSSWHNLGTLGSNIDMTTLTGSVRSETTNGVNNIEALCFDSSQTEVTFIDYDLNSATRPDLTMEVWWRPDDHGNNKNAVLGHDTGSWDRQIIVYDARFDGLAMGVGSRYTSTLGVPELGEWIHIVVTYSADGEATLYLNGGDLAGGSQQSRTVTTDTGGFTTMSLNGQKKWGEMQVIGCFAQVQMTNRVLSGEEVVALFDEFDAVVNSVEIPLVYRGNIVNGEGTTCSGTDCLAECEGDCDSDFHCEEGLVCWHRDGDDIPIPPGCTGDAQAAHTDYCYDPAKKQQNDEGKWPYVHRGHNHDAREGPLQECEGECDNDDNCAAGLQCFHRDSNQVPGCYGGTHGSGDSTGGAEFDYCYDPSLNVNAAAHSMSVEGENGAEHDAVQRPVDDMNPIALTLIGAVVVVVIALLFVMMRGRTKKEQTAKETVAEMSEVVDAPQVVHVADDTVEVPTETAVAEPSMPETTVNGMEEVVEVKVNTESV